jgi:AbiV family abortive infection protein
MDGKLLRARTLCLDQAESFIAAADRLGGGTIWSHIVYHLSLLALEELGKASMLAARAITHNSLDPTWIERSLDNHRRKLQWAVWSPLTRIDPVDFEAARQFAERAHAMRLSSLYVDPNAELTNLPPVDVVQAEDAQNALGLARARLEQERARGIPTGEVDELTTWFLDAMADPERSRIMLSRPFIAKYEELNGEPREWVRWVRKEIDRLDGELRALAEEELKRPAAGIGAAKPRWRANMTVYTPSHSLRAGVLTRWNKQLDHVQLIWAGKKDRFTLQITLHDNLPLPSLPGRLASLSKLVLACLNIATIGYFWFEPPGFEQEMFRSVRDLERDLFISVGVRESFWGTGRAVAMTGEMIDRAVTCMMAFLPLSEKEAEPIFSHYFHGLAFIAKSDVYYNFDQSARNAFIFSLFGALRQYGGWNGAREEIDSRLHEAFLQIVPERQNRELLFKSLTVQGNPAESSLANLRTAKQIADLYLIHVANRTWQRILDAREGEAEGTSSE